MSKPLTHTQYCLNHMARQNAAYYNLPNGKGIYYLDGKHYTPAEFAETFPIDGRLVSKDFKRKGQRKDIYGRRNWLNS